MFQTSTWCARLAVAALALGPGLAASQVAPLCGTPGTPPCDLPEPGSWALVALALAVVGVVARSRRK